MSAVQPQSGLSQATGPASTGSSPIQPLRERWATALGKMQLLGQLVGFESIRRNLKREDDLAERDALAYQGAIHPSASASLPEGDQMGHIVLGDMVEHHHQSPQKSCSLAKAALVAAGIATGGGAVAALPLLASLFDRNPRIETRTETKVETKTRDYRVGPIEVIEP